jgi:hypothetical protein
METENVIGLVLDLSPVCQDGVPLLEIVKKQLIAFFRDFIEGEDLFYLYNEPDFVINIGKIVSLISNYKKNLVKFNLKQALLQTFYFVAGEDEDFKKSIIVVSDQIENIKDIEFVSKFTERQFIDVQFIFLCFRDCGKDLQLPNFTFVNLTDAMQIAQVLKGFYVKTL